MSNKAVLVGGSWLIAGRAFYRFVGIISITILARLLTPADFGVVAIASTVVAMVELFGSFGFDWALVRYKHVADADLNTAWTLRLLIGVCTFAVLALLGPVAAAFYRQPALTLVLVWLGFGSFIASLENIGTVFFRRDFAFHKEFLWRSASKVAALLVTLPLAFAYRSYWALIAGMLATRISATTMSYALHPYKPRLSLKNWRSLLGYSIWLLFTNIIEYCREKFSDLYLGRVFGSRATGLFAVAGEISIVPLTEIAAPINRAAYSKYADDVRSNRELEPSYLSIASLIWIVALPISAGTVATANEVVALILGPQWAGAASVLRLLATGAALTVMTANTQYVYWALGHSRVVAVLSVIGVVILIPLTILCSYYEGYQGAALAFALASALAVPLNFFMLRRYTGIRFRSLWRRTWRVTFGAAAMAGTLLVLFPERTPVGVATAMRMFAAKVAVGSLTYVLIVCGAWLLFGRPDGPERTVIQLIREQTERLFKRRLAIYRVP